MRYMYISGPISSKIEKGEDCNADFQRCEDFIYKNFQDCIIVNPIVLNAVLLKDWRILNPSWNDYMWASISHLVMHRDVDICLLPGWETSAGAKAELFVAKTIGAKVFVFEHDPDRITEVSL